MDYQESRIGTSKKIKFRNQHKSVDAKKKSVPTNFDQHVLYDTMKMYKGAQDQRINSLLDNGKSQLGQIKNKKVDPNVTLTEQLSAYRQKMNPFYRTKNINVVTEN